MKVVIFWVGLNGYGYGKPCDLDVAMALVREMTRKYPEMEHKAVDSRQLELELLGLGIDRAEAHRKAIKAFESTGV